MDAFSTTVVTLAGALLGLTVTFASQLIRKVDTAPRSSLLCAWFLSILAIGFGVAAHGLVVRYLKIGKSADWAVFFANAAFYALLASTIAFGVFGYHAIHQPRAMDTAAIVERAITSMPGISGDRNSKWELKSLNLDSRKNTYDLVMSKENSAEAFSLTLDLAGSIIRAEKN